jgi:hypothetical protein
MAHPLRNSSRWDYDDPDMGMIVPYMFVGPKKKRRPQTVRTSGSCREGIIDNLRAILQSKLTTTQFVGPETWRKKTLMREDSRIVLEHRSAQRATLWIDRPCHREGIVLFPQVADYILGTCSVLLSSKGKWWRTKYPFHTEEHPKSRASGNKIFWRGSNNWFLQHPATVSLATGLLRQCFSLCTGGFGQQVLDTVSSAEVEGVLTGGDPKKAVALAKKLRTWIEVPPGDYAYPEHYAVPEGTWGRLISFHRAVQRYGYEETLGQDFVTGWNLPESKGLEYYKGAEDFWGEPGEPTYHYQRLMKLGAPGKRKR